MKRARSGTEMRKSFKKTKHNDSSIGVLAKELQTEIFARVAMGSCADINRCKSSCKLFKEIAEDGYIYRNVSLEEIPIVSWFPNKNRESFLERCEHYQNPEPIFRQAVVDYFSKESTKTACEYLEKAIGLGHEGASYLSCILLMYSGNEELKEEGIKLLGGLWKSTNGRRQVRESRKKLMKHLRMIWVNKLRLMPRPTCCKTIEENHRKKLQWDANEYEDSLECEACVGEFELRCISGEFSPSYLL